MYHTPKFIDMDRLTIFILCLVSVFTVSNARHMLRKQIGNNEKLSVRNDSKSSANMFAEEALDEEFMEIVKQCNSTYLTPEYFIQMNETGELPAEGNHISKCHLHCILSSIKMVDEKGNLNPVVAKIFTNDDEELMQCDSVKRCMTEELTNKDACEQTYERISCLIKERINKDGDKSHGM